MRVLATILALIVFAPSLAYPHPGGLDKCGGHYNLKTGGYHCHREPCFIIQQQKGECAKQRTQPTLEAFVVSVIDGDTIKVVYNEKLDKVRLIGVDTPETKHPQKLVEYFGKEASAFTTRMAEGKKVRLEFDQTLRDRYGRLLAYVYLPDGRMLNAETIHQGYGHAYTRHPFKYLEWFMRLEKEAREAWRGLWGNNNY